MQFFKIILVSVVAAVAYGIVHDQITARICIEYFTVGHLPVFSTESPTLLSLGWGVIATWWVGLILGVPLAMASRCGNHTKLTARSLRRPILLLLLIMSLAALTAGIVGYVLALAGKIWLTDPLASEIAKSLHARFLADLWAHLASYGSGFIGGLILIGWVWRKRRKSVQVSFTHDC
ncbi:MAG TPA: hypothetical protein VN887_17475 [Candidatus Angelobacter sp.]|nr:hypothetical protein [Candidatus Angelobacter sp.]